MAFPEVKFGICPKCGGGGTSDDGDTQESGYRLKLYDGEYLCQICINEEDDLKHDRRVNEQIAEDERFRGQAGVNQA